MRKSPTELHEMLASVLAASQARGFLGPGDTGTHLSNARGFSELIPAGSRVLDLGSGGGVPGLPLVVSRPDLHVSLLDSAARRIRFLDGAIASLGEVDSQVTERTEALWGRAEDLGKDPRFRGSFDVVTARLFGRPAVVAECARPFTRPSGILIVSEPPNPPDDRWPSEPLEAMGWGATRAHRFGESGFVVLVAVDDCPIALPRRVGVVDRRPAF